ncbi:MAG: SIS domain-containing protein [Pseudomonadota bacterium]|nr:SIS domain-containing protein [Pseudomonadota bacterium]
MLERVEASLAVCSPAEARVGRLLLADPRHFAAQPIAEIARRAEVSKPTVVRFCRHIGYRGLTDFRLKLAGVINEGMPYVHRAVTQGDGAAELMVKVIDNSVSALLNLRNQASAGAIERAADAIVAAIRMGRRVEFYGVGNSGIVAQDAQHKFFRLGCNTVAYSDGHMQVMAATMLQPGDVAVIISNSGRMRDLLDTIDVVRRRRATAVAITASGSPLAARADILLAADHREDFDRYSPMVSRMLHLMLIDVLTTAVAVQLGPEIVANLQAIKRNLRVKYTPDDSGR